MIRRNDKTTASSRPFWKRHSLSLTAAGILTLWFVLYLQAESKTHAGAFLGNAIADWTGVVISYSGDKMVLRKGLA